MSGRGRRVGIAVAAAVVTAATIAGFGLARAGREDPAPEAAARASASSSETSPTASASPDVPIRDLEVRLGRVKGWAIGSKLKRRWLVGPAEDLRDTMASLYTAAFVDPAGNGRFGAVWDHFADRARSGARRDVNGLTLGPAARRLVAVSPGRSRLTVRFLVGTNRRPVVAVADMRFAATGIAEDAELPITHEARYVLHRFEGGWRIVAYRVRGRVPTPQEVRRAVAAELSPGLDDRLFVLAIGSDSRPGKPPARGLADSLHIIGVNPERGTASIVGIPRDSFVSIPGVGTRKVNESLFYGGPELTVRTVENLAGIRIDAYVLTAFEGFKRLVTEVGGLDVRIPYAMSDYNSQAYFRPGPAHLNGKKALAFSRNRYDAPGGDFGRSMNQGRVIVAALEELRKDLRKDPSTLIRWLVAGSRHLETDLSLPETLELLLAAATIDPARVKNVVVAGSGGFAGAQSVVRLGSGALATFRDLARDARIGGR